MSIASNNQKKMLVIGLDCAEPSLVFDRLADKLPAFRALARSGFAARLRSTDPPLTIPAWASMTTGKDPGQLGCYGVRNRENYQYDSLHISTSRTISPPRIWDTLSRSGKKSIVLGVPQTYPVTPINGTLVSGMLTPDTTSHFTWPPEFRQELLGRFPDYRIDIGHFRSLPPEQLVEPIFAMTRTRFAALRYMLSNKTWDFAMMVEIALDRLHHGFWHYWDKTHPLYPGETSLARVLPDYYQLLDQEISETISVLPDNTAVLVVSDHGAQPMKGGFRINQWLIQNGYLTLKQMPVQEQPLSPEIIDWQHTMAWGEGGYFGRIFLNIAGREPCGIVNKPDYDRIRNEIASRLESLPEFWETGQGTPGSM
ncbi:alkaline phosphatase family protein, partial [bacterium]|nr:alkaline phosphatase family protein [bacterium]